MNQSPTVHDALGLRMHTQALFARQCSSASYVQRVATLPASAWRFFLAAEACATPVRAALGDAIGKLDVDVRAVLDRACSTELQRMLAAQLQLTMIDRAAQMSDTYPIVLKGGVPIGEGEHAFDLGDVDVLVAPDEAPRLERALVDLGANLDDALRLPGTLSTEIHTELDTGSGVLPATDIPALPLPRFTRLRRLVDVAHAAYIIQHCTTHHVERRGNLRDTMLLVRELRTFSRDALRQLHAVLDPLPDRALYERFLNRAMCILRGEPLRHDPNTARVMAAHYAMIERWPADTGFVPHTLRALTMFLVGSPADVPRAIRLFLFNPINNRSRWLAHPLAKYAPSFWRNLSYVARTPYRLAVLAYAAGVAIRFRIDFDRTQPSEAQADEPNRIRSSNTAPLA